MGNTPHHTLLSFRKRRDEFRGEREREREREREKEHPTTKQGQI
jgi:hypothetical protein